MHGDHVENKHHTLDSHQQKHELAPSTRPAKSGLLATKSLQKPSLWVGWVCIFVKKLYSHHILHQEDRADLLQHVLLGLGDGLLRLADDVAEAEV